MRGHGVRWGTVARVHPLSGTTIAEQPQVAELIRSIKISLAEHARLISSSISLTFSTIVVPTCTTRDAHTAVRRACTGCSGEGGHCLSPQSPQP